LALGPAGELARQRGSRSEVSRSGTGSKLPGKAEAVNAEAPTEERETGNAGALTQMRGHSWGADRDQADPLDYRGS
jgi:hypothetical protein